MSVLTQIQINTGSGDPVTADIGAKAINVSYNNGIGQADTTVQDEISNLKTSAVTELDDLTDVTIDNTLADGQTLVYDGTNHVFKNGESSAANKMDIDGSNAATAVNLADTETFSIGGTTLSRFKVDEDGFISTAKNDVPIAFGKDEYGQFGYYKEKNGELTPFDFKTGYLDWDYTTPSGYQVINLPYAFSEGSAVVLNNEIHILGSDSTSQYKKHYKWNGSTWVSVSTLPYNFSGSSASAVVLNGEIHIIGINNLYASHYKWNGSTWVSVSELSSTYIGPAVVLNGEIHVLGIYKGVLGYTGHSKWNGSTWVSVSDLPHSFRSGSAVVLNDEIHILGNENYPTDHYKWDGSTWTSVSTLPYEFHLGSAVVLDGEINILGGFGTSSSKHYKWDGSSWTQNYTPWQDALPYDFYQGSAVVLDGEIHILGSYSTSDRTKHFKLNKITNEWESVSTLPYNFYLGSAVVLNNEIHILGSNVTDYYRQHYKLNKNTNEWESVSTLPYDFYGGSAVILNNEIHILGGYSTSYRKAHYKWNGTSWASGSITISTLPYNFCEGSAVVLDGEIHILGGNSSSSYNTKHYKWNGSSWTLVSTLPYNFQSGSAVVLDGETHILGSSITNNTKRSYASSKEADVLKYLLPITEYTSDDYYLGANHSYNDILAKIKSTMLSSANISTANAGYGTLTGDTTGVNKTLSSSSPKILLLFTLEQNKTSKALRGMHAYAFAPYYASTAATALTAARINVASSSSTGVTITTGSNTGLINIKCSSTAYTVKYWWFCLDNGSFL